MLSDIRKCRVCGEIKPITDYHKSSKGVNGRDSRCRDCKNKAKRERDKNPESKSKNKAYYTSEKYRERRRSLKRDKGGYEKLVQRSLDKIENKKRAGSRYISKEEAKEFGLPRYFDGSICKRGHISERYTSNSSCSECSIVNAKRSERVKNKKDYYESNKEKLIKQNVVRQRERYSESIEFKASVAARNMLKRVLRQGGRKKHGGSYEMLGYSREDLMDRMESLFSIDMSWENYGDWHIDHIKPVSWFIKNGITNPAEINALDNLQPLWAQDNYKKGDSVDCLQTMGVQCKNK